MNKIKILIFALLIGLLFIPKLIAEDTVNIKSIELEDLSVNAIENSKPEFQGLTLDFDLEFREVNNYVKYKIIIDNSTDKEYFLSSEKYFSDSEYLTYSYQTEKGISPNSESVVYLTISYDKEVDLSKYEDKMYVEDNEAEIKLLNEDGQAATNPDTGDGTTLIILALVLALSLVWLGIINKDSVIKLSVFTLCILPLIVSASNILKLQMNVNVQIQKVYSVDYAYNYYSNVLIKYSELDEHDLTRATCQNIYVNEQREENKYKICYGTIIHKMPKKYIYGETVYKDVKYEILENDISIDKDCTAIEDGFKICNNVSIYSTTNKYWGYDGLANEELGYIYNQEEVNDMSFECLETECTYYDTYIGLKSSYKFIMPDHDILISCKQPLPG